MDSSRSLSRRLSFTNIKKSLRKRLSSRSLKECSVESSVPDTSEPSTQMSEPGTQDVDFNNTQNIDLCTEDFDPIVIDLETPSAVSKTDFGTQGDDTCFPRMGAITRKAIIPIKDTKSIETKDTKSIKTKDTPFYFHDNEEISLSIVQATYKITDDNWNILHRLYKTDKTLLSNPPTRHKLKTCGRSVREKGQDSVDCNPAFSKHCDRVNEIIISLLNGEHHSIRPLNRAPKEHRLKVEKRQTYNDMEEKVKSRNEGGEVEKNVDSDMSVDYKNDKGEQPEDEAPSVISDSG